MKAYKLIIGTQNRTSGEVFYDEIIYLLHNQALTHQRTISRRFQDSQTDTTEIVDINIEEMSKQKILLTGAIAGFQFADRGNMGHRTITRTVRNLERTELGITGTIKWHNRVIKVQHNDWSPNYDWEALYIVGYC